MIDQLCQAYHWPYSVAMTMTMPQIIMLGHAASVNNARMKASMDAKARGRETKKQQDDKDPVVFHGKRLSQLNSDEMAAYYNDWS